MLQLSCNALYQIALTLQNYTLSVRMQYQMSLSGYARESEFTNNGEVYKIIGGLQNNLISAKK